jgi:hypothetical protein
MTKTMRTAAIALGVGLVAGQAMASMDIQKKAKALGYPATNCLYCHGEGLPKKDKFTLNDRGKWLDAEREKRKEKSADASWLKDYTEPKGDASPAPSPKP